MATVATCPCIQKAKPDEPVFTLLARDPLAPILVRLWAMLREERGKDAGDARVTACEMAGWRHARRVAERTWECCECKQRFQALEVDGRCERCAWGDRPATLHGEQPREGGSGG